jgi:cellulose synthase/poly-beta-1,6-N-acetylglucosamine synthase-like glycosyltransferase
MLTPSDLAAAAAIAWGLAAAAYALAQGLLLVYAAHRWVVLLRHRPAARDVPAGGGTPVVTVQLPLYNERLVAERLIDAAAALDWPADRLEIQVLDDSTDDTPEIVARAVARHAARGVDITHWRRGGRDGFKAGALAHGLARARGWLVAVFDADFVPPPDFLRRAVPRFGDPRVGMVQARWGHLNRERSLLTRAQAVMLDSHFLLEHATRASNGLFFNFNGTAGVWRRTCIEDAGGWSHRTLTEDLDLSYRAQLRGWRFVFVPDLVTLAELPCEAEAYKSQQRRWARGSIQTAREILPGLLRAPLPWAVKVEAAVHLTANAAYPLLLFLALLLPVILAGPPAPASIAAGLHLLTAALGVVPVALFMALGQRAAGRPWTRALGDVAAAMVVAVGMSVNNARAVLDGFRPETGAWERTPKSGDGGRRGAGGGYRAGRGRAGASELALAALFLGVALWSAAGGRWHAMPFLGLLVAGLGVVGLASLRESRRPSPAAARG